MGAVYYRSYSRDPREQEKGKKEIIYIIIVLFCSVLTLPVSSFFFCLPVRLSCFPSLLFPSPGRVLVGLSRISVGRESEGERERERDGLLVDMALRSAPAHSRVTARDAARRCQAGGRRAGEPRVHGDGIGGVDIIWGGEGEGETERQRDRDRERDRAVLLVLFCFFLLCFFFSFTLLATPRYAAQPGIYTPALCPV